MLVKMKQGNVRVKHLNECMDMRVKGGINEDI